MTEPEGSPMTDKERIQALSLALFEIQTRLDESKKRAKEFELFVAEIMMRHAADNAFQVGMLYAFHSATLAMVQTHPDKAALRIKFEELSAAVSSQALFHTSESQLQGVLAAQELIESSMR